ncbi:hypothetical protein KHM83_04330 [Fusibacter paucivorans]|uniref:DUF5067 domain-containing protein n=1 Tax=Fusibacter paucivorans TaxID=76009 RepID=A0ABS5PLF7_9FIRM|nr:hypothetical protein [Fusibacter paucivorans]MBS7525903.1 hypothetical protein [Fusibacter paucivorans]
MNRKMIIGVMIIAVLLAGCSCARQADEALSETEAGMSAEMESVSPEEDAQMHTNGETDEQTDVYTIASLGMQDGVAYEAMIFIDAFDRVARTLAFNAVEWIDTPERASEVGIDYDRDMPGGFYIYDAGIVKEQLPVSDALCYYTLNESTPMKADESVLWEFVDYMESEGFNYPFNIRILNGEITQIEQVYLP